MIFTDRTIIVQKGISSINDTIILYRGDKEVEIRFTLNESSPFRFGIGAEPNIIEKTEAAYGQLIIKRPNDLPAVFSEIAPTNEGKIIFTITAEMIDEITEVGNYTFQIRLLDESRNSRATLPEVVNGIEIREPIATEDVSATNEVGKATVGYALTTAGTTEDAFDTQGNYNKTTWGTGDRITDAKLNKIEAGIDVVNKKVANVGGSGEVDLSGYATLNSPNFTGDISLGRKIDTTVGTNSVAMGNNVTASGGYSHAEGNSTTASGDYSHAEGCDTTASSTNQHVQGKYNIEDTADTYAHIVGNGTSNTRRSNAHTLDWQGNAWYQGKISQDGVPIEDKDLTTKKYVDDAIGNIEITGASNINDTTASATTTYSSNKIENIKENLSSQINEIVNVADLAQEGNNVYIKDSNGNKVGNGITISSSSSSSSEITKDFINSNKYKLTWLGERFAAPSDYVAWGGSMRYEPRLGKFVQWLYCAPAHLHSTAQLYVVYIDKNTLVADEPVHCVYYDTDGSTQLNFDNEAGVSVRCLEDGTYQLIKNIKGGTADIKYRFNSTDYGKTWIKGETISTPSGVDGFDDIVTLSNGRLITSYGGPIFYSDNDGMNWTISTPATAGGNYEAEANFLELKPGVVMAIARYSMGGGTAGDGTPDPAIVAYSYDYGTTWTPWKKSKSILDMNAIGCKGIMHDGFVELFVCSRWYDNINKYTETGNRGAIYHYVASVDEALNDNFTNLGIIHYFKNSPREVMAPDFAIDDNNEMLFSQACGGGSVTCTKFYAKGTKINYFSLIDDTNKSSFASYSNMKVDELINNLTLKVLELQHALSQIPGSGVDEPTGTLVWTKTFDVNNGDVDFKDESSPFYGYFSSNAGYTKTTDTLGNNIMTITKNPTMEIPITKSNYALEMTLTVEGRYDGFPAESPIFLCVGNNILSFVSIYFYYSTFWFRHASGSITDTKYGNGDKISILDGDSKVTFPNIVTVRLIHEETNGNTLYIKYGDIEYSQIFTDEDCISVDDITFNGKPTQKGFKLACGCTPKLHSLKFGEWN